jgi:hypothetical protein
VECGINVRIALQTAPFSDSPGSYFCTRTLPTTNFCPNSLDIPSHKPVTYPPGFGLLTQFGHPFMDDRLDYGLNESLGTRAVAPKSERQTMTLIGDDCFQNSGQA